MCKKIAKWVVASSLKSSGLLLVLSACAATAFGKDINVPEIDPASASSALMLLIGGLLMLTGRRSGR
jgi:hypothetical protein